MEKFLVFWYSGDILARDIKEIIAKKVVEADDIKSVDPLVVLDDKTKKNVYYTRFMLVDDKTITCDYGSYSKFICVIKTM